MKELAQLHRHVVWKGHLVERAVHERDPAIACRVVDRERHVAHTQSRMSALLEVARRSAESADHEIPQPLFRANQIVFRIHRTENVVLRNLCVKGMDQPGKSFFTDTRVNVVFCHNLSMSDEAPKSALELAMERLRKKDVSEGIAELTLTDEQREEIAEIRRVYSAKIAQEEILQKSKLATTWEPEERSKLEEGYRREIQRLNEERDRKIEKVRQTGR